MKNTEKNVLIFLLLMGTFCAIMISGIFLAPKYSQFFFHGIMILSFVALVFAGSPTFKDFLFLILALIVLGVTANIVGGKFDANTLLGFIVHAVCLAPIYCFLLKHVIKILVQTKRRNQIEDANN